MKIKIRKLYRILVGSLFPVIYFFTPDKTLILVFTFYLLGIMTVIEILRKLSPGAYQVMVEHSGGILKENPGKIMGTTAYLLSVIILVLAFNKLVVIYALAFTIFGDAASTLIGKRFGTRRFWSGKSIEGLVGFIISTFIIGALLNLIPSLSIGIKKIIWGSIFSGIVEFLPLYVDDNLSVPVLTGIFLYFVL